MKKVEDLNVGFSDANNYTQRKNKAMFNEIFVKNHYLDELIQINSHFLIGEKGTGKTAYAAYLNNNEIKNTKSILKFISATDYEKFYILKKNNNLDLTAYSNIWKVIILLLLAKSITQDDTVISVFQKNKITQINQAIDDYYKNAFSPEIISVLKFIDESEAVAKVMSKYFELGGKIDQSIEFTETRFQTKMLFIEKQLQDIIASIKLSKNFILLIDGIDIRPDTIPYTDYIECIRGLATASLNLNNEFFPNIKDNKFNFKVVLLLRPDIFNSLNLQNSTNKLLDNTVFLDWRTTYKEYENSPLFKIALNLLNYEQDEEYNNLIFDKYFPWQLKSTSPERSYDTAFMDFLRITLSRPRDILVIMKLIKTKMVKDRYGNLDHFLYDTYNSDEFQNNYSQYFISSLRDQLLFYYSSTDFEYILKFFDYFDNSDFSYNTFVSNYDLLIEYVCNNATEIPPFFEDHRKLLQLLYDSNVITAIDNSGTKPYFKFSYREKDYANINPKVPIGDNIEYRFHYGMYKKTKFGRF